MTHSVIVRSLAIALAFCAASACSTLDTKLPARARYEIEERFVALVDEDQIAVRVASQMTEGALSDEELQQLSKFICHILRNSGDFTIVHDLTSGAEQATGQLLLDVHVTKFQVASKADLAAGTTSHLDGIIQLTGPRDSNHGRAKIWASGYRLALDGKTEAPDTVVQFSSTIIDLIQ